MEKIKNILRCPDCKNDKLVENSDRSVFTCESCNKTFKTRGKSILFFSVPNDEQSGDRPDGLIFKIKNFLKHHPKLFFFIYNLMVFVVGKKPKDLIKNLPENSVVVNIGSGIMEISPEVINVDISPYPNVDVVSSAYNLPFKDGSIDMIISESLLEHLDKPHLAIDEIRRVLKKDGLIYIVTPFVFGFHSSPGDYYRWTTEGLREIFKDFKEIEIGVNVGVTSATTSLLREWLAIILSFNSKTLYQLWTMFFMVIFIPINLLDFLIYKLKFSTNVAQALCYIGRKK